MKIIHIITRMIVGGAQENTLLTCRDLMQRHHDDVLLLTGPETGPEGNLLELTSGVPTQTIPSLRRAISPWRDWRAYRELVRAIRAYKPQVVHTHSAKAGVLGRMAAYKANVPVIVHTVHGAPFHKYQNEIARRFGKFAEWYAARRCDRLISVADAMTEQLTKARIAPREKFVTIRSGMDAQSFLTSDRYRRVTRERLGIGEETIVVGKVARLFPLKGHDDLIIAAEKVAAANRFVKFLLIGDGILRDKLEKRLEQRGLSKNFIFAGLVPPEEMPHYLSAIDLLVHTSLREGLARALPQALLCGKPVVSYDIDGAREVCRHNETGFLLAPRDTSGLAKAILQLAGDAALRDRMGKRGRGNFATAFDHPQQTVRIRQLYEEEWDLAGHSFLRSVRKKTPKFGQT